MTHLDTERRQESPRDFSPDEKPLSRIIFSWVVLISATVFIVFSQTLLGYLAWQPDSWLVPIMKEHFAALFGIPMAAMIATVVVILLSITAGPVEFEGFKIKLKGAAGEVLFWVICFAVISGAFRLLW
jgi:hypothetical protein